MTRETLLALADRVEKLSGPCRETDAEIVTTLCPGATVGEYIRGDGDDIVFHAEAIGIPNKEICPFFTASIDAAMALVPDGMIWMLTNAGIQHPHRPDFSKASAVVDHWESTAPMKESEGASAALALTAAALRARAETL